MTQTLSASMSIPFKDFVLINKRNRITLWIALALIIIQFTIFKYFYPFASYIHGDSFSYIKAANENLSINTYMVGYSNFLRLFSVFTKSDTILVAFQYMLAEGSALFFLFTLFYFYNTSKIVEVVLLSFMVLNPLLLHLGNLISSDCLFLSLSLIWFTLLLWIIHKISGKVIFWHAVILFIAFTVRYNALMYPFISAGALIFSRLTLRKKVIGIASGILLCSLFVGFTSYKYKQLTDYWQYSPFSGWQWANNAMYAYRYVDSTDRKPVPEKFQALDNMIRQYFDTTRNTKKFPVESVMASTFYMWSPSMPLMKYKNTLFKNDSSAIELKKWASLGPLYKDYGIYIIKKYPWHYLKYFIYPNALKYYSPPVEFLERYNSGNKTVALVAVKWFDYANGSVKVRLKDKDVWILNYYPILSGIINVVMLSSLICLALLNGFKVGDYFSKAVLLAVFFWLLNAGFTICASSAALRFQSFPIIMAFTFSVLMIGHIAAKAGEKKEVRTFNKNSLTENNYEAAVV